MPTVIVTIVNFVVLFLLEKLTDFEEWDFAQFRNAALGVLGYAVDCDFARWVVSFAAHAFVCRLTSRSSARAKTR